MTRATLSALCIGAGALIACGPSDEQRGEMRRAADSVAAAESASAQAKRVVQAGEVASTKRQLSTMLDSIHAMLAMSRADDAATALHAASRYAQVAADSASGASKRAFAASATSLERLAGRARKSELKSNAAVDHAFAALELNEARVHLDRATRAWKTNKPAVAGPEYAAAVDHLQAAYMDAGQTQSVQTLRAQREARAFAEKLTQGESIVPAELTASFRVIDQQIKKLTSSVAGQTS